MRRMLHTTTAIFASLSLALPGGAAAQTSDLTESQLEACRTAAEGGGEDPLVVTVDGSEVSCPPVAELTEDEPAAEPETAAPEAETPVDGVAPGAAEAEAETEPAAEAEATAEPAAETDAEVITEPAVDASDPAAAPAGDAAPAEGAAPVEGAAPAEGAQPVDGVDPVDSSGVTPETETDAAAAPDPVAEEEIAPAESAADEPATAEEPVLEPATAEPAETAEGEVPAAEEPALADAPESATAEEPAETVAEQPAAEQPAEEPAEAAATEVTPADEPVAAEAPAAEEPVEATAEAPSQETTGAEAQAELPPEEAPTPEETVDPTVMEAAALSAESEGEVTTEVVTEENARSSDEDFATELSTEAAATATAAEASAEEDDEDEDRFSNLEKALLLGAGALVVGSVLRGGREVVATSGDRAIVQTESGEYQVIKDDSALLRQPGSEVETETFSDGSTRTTVYREDGSRIVTIRDPELRVLRRTRITPDGQEIALIDDTVEVEPVDVSRLPEPRPAEVYTDSAESLRTALAAENQLDRRFSLYQVRDIREVRELAPSIDVGSVTFETGSAAITPDQARDLNELGQTIAELIDENPREVFLVEGHTDAVGSAAMNLALSDRRAESLALALTEYFDVPPENLVVQGYGERYLRVPTQTAERENRRVAVRRITPLLQTAAAN